VFKLPANLLSASKILFWIRFSDPPTGIGFQIIQLLLMHQIRSDQISPSVVSDSLWPHESQHTRPPCPSPTPGVHWDSRPSSQWCHPAISSSVWLIFHCIYINIPHLFIYSSVIGSFACFHILITVNSTAMNIGVHVSFWIVFCFFLIYAQKWNYCSWLWKIQSAHDT